MTHQEMFDALQQHARKNYTKGWDWIVECEEFGDFMTEVKNHELADWHQVFEHYEIAVKLRKDYADDIRAEADYDW